MELTGKKVLLIIPAFYGYEKLIKEGLEKLGATVSYLENKAFRNDPVTRDTKWYLTILCRKNSYIRNKLIPAFKNTFDVCLFINLFSFHPELTEILKKQNPNIINVLYLWDNVKGYRWEQFFKHFDKIYSFDPIESRKLGIKYLPNFYVTDFPLQHTIKFDLSFVGSLQVHRLKILEELVSNLNHQNKTVFFYLYLHPNYNRLKFNKYIQALLNIFPGQFKGYKLVYDLITGKKKHALVSHRSLTISESIQSMANSSCILDLPFPSQTGSTQRVIQALALQKKVITTNSAVTEESFYNPDYIKVASSKSLVIDWNWVNRKSEVVPNINHLRLDNWLKQLFEI
jgi:hypothetical protein